MLKHKFIKKLSIAIASLALVCPLTLSINQPVHASRIYVSRNDNKFVRPVRHLTLTAFLNDHIHRDEQILNSKRGRYYLSVYKNLNKQEKQLANLKEHHAKSTFTPIYKNGKPKYHHKALSLAGIYEWKKDMGYFGYVRANKRTKIYKLHFGKYGYLDKIIGSRWIRNGRIFHVSPLNHGAVITRNGFPKNYINRSYEWIL